MEQPHIFQALCGILAELCGLPLDDVRAESHLLLDLGLTSLKFIDLTLALEKKFGFEFPLQDWVDAQQERGDDAFRVASLLQMCECLSDVHNGVQESSV